MRANPLHVGSRSNDGTESRIRSQIGELNEVGVLRLTRNWVVHEPTRRSAQLAASAERGSRRKVTSGTSRPGTNREAFTLVVHNHERVMPQSAGCVTGGALESLK